MASKYDGLARIILQNVGGKGNVAGLTHCITRLRFKLKDDSKANTEILKETEGVVTVIQNGEQYMVVIGNHVADVYDAVVAVGHLETIVQEKEDGGGEELSGKKRKNPLDVFVGIVTGVFAPVLGVLTASGILKGVIALFVAAGILDGASGTYNILNALSDALFFYFPIILGYTSAKKFGISEFEGLVIGAAMVYPSLLSSGTADISNLFGIPVVMPASGDYSSSVIPVICAVAFAGWFEKRYKKWIPDTIKMFAVPLITCFVTVCMTFWVIGPVASVVSGLIGEGFMAVYRFSPVLMGAVVGAFWQVLVMFGLHWAISSVMFNNIQTLGFDTVMIGMFGASFAQTGAVLAIYLKTKNKKLKNLCVPAIISGIAGVTEPAIYGITLPKKKPFVITCLISGIAGGFMAAAGTRYYTVPGMGVFGYPSFVNAAENSFSGILWAIVISVVTFAVSTVVVYLTYHEDTVVDNKDRNMESAKEKGQEPAETEDKITIAAPLSGKVIPLGEVADEAFSSGALGQGAAILPEEGKLYAPADGEITVLFPTGHAVGLMTEDGAELLIHIGMDTVSLDGRGFEKKISQGDHVKKGELLVEFDLAVIREAGLSAVTPVIITNTDRYRDVAATEEDKVTAGQAFLTAVRQKNIE